MRALVTVVALALVGLTAPSAYAETWSASDRSRDVRVTVLHVGAAREQCPSPPRHRAPSDARRDITSLAVDHGADSVVLTVGLRRVTRRDETTALTIHLRTDGRDVMIGYSPAPRGVPEVFLAEEPDYPEPGEACSFVFAVGEEACEGLSADRDAHRDLVTVSVPRRCLGNPVWVRAGVQSYSTAAPDASGTLRLHDDHWAPPGVRQSGFLPPFGPRVEQG